MKRIILSAFLIIMAAAVLIYGMPVIKDQVVWSEAVRENVAEAYNVYMEKFPSGFHINEAIGLFDEKSWDEAVAGNTPESFERYLKNVTDGKYAQKARENIEHATWKYAEQTDTYEAYRHYLELYPQGGYVEQAYAGAEGFIWEEALNQKTVESFQYYLSLYPSGQYTSQAYGEIDEIDWDKAKEYKTLASMQQYIDNHPEGKYTGEAESFREAILNDDALFEAAQQDGTRQAYEDFLAMYPGHKSEDKARIALEEITADETGRNIVDLIEQGKVSAKITGSDITGVNLEIKRQIDRDILVLIPAGTYFIANDSSVQNMVATSGSTIELDTDDWTSIYIDAACANIERSVPGEDNGFGIRRSAGRAELEELMPFLDDISLDYYIKQAAVWIITDDADYGDLGTLVSGFGGYGPRVIEEYEAAMAMKIISDAGIDITSKSIWYDRWSIAEALEDEELKSWLQN